MNIVYFNNYRGFKETFLSLSQVNFFVGENSTGKTSVLKLIKAISDPRLYFVGELNSEESELGYFNEIVSINSKERYFEIGTVGETNEDNYGGLKMKFIDKDGQPFLQEIRVINERYDLQAVINGKNFKYRLQTFNSKPNIKNKTKEFLKDWMKKPSSMRSNYKEVDTKETFFPSIWFQLQSTLASKFKEEFDGISVPGFFRDVIWLAPIRTEPKRTYDSYKSRFNPDGTHAPYILKKLLSKKKGSKERKKIDHILKRFGNDSGLYDEIHINPLGKTNTSPFEIRVSLNKNQLKITNVGYGVSQILPLIVEVISSNDNSWFAIQQPEIHLHPKAQAAFGDFIFKSSELNKMNFIIETHSDYTIDRFRLKQHKRNSGQNDVINSQVVFFERTNSGNKLSCIEISSNGEYSDKQPKSFRNFFLKEQMELLHI